MYACVIIINNKYAFMWDGCTIIVISANVVMTVARVFIQLLHFIMNDENLLWGDVWCVSVC